MASGGVYSGQALFLGNFMDVFSPELNQRRSNFFALMFFIMAIYLLFVYMAMGWVSNHLAQVSQIQRVMFLILPSHTNNDAGLRS